MYNQNNTKGAISWMAGNKVASNILMLLLLVGGFFIGSHIKQEVFPEFSMDTVTVSVSYPGASPEEVEQGIVLPIEEAVQDIEGIEEIRSNANEGSAAVRIEAITGTDVQKLADDIKNEVDRIQSFPEDAEEPLVKIDSRKRDVLTIVVYGDLNDMVLRWQAEFIRDELMQDKEITQVDFSAEKNFEMSIEVSLEKLKAYDLKLSDIARKIKAASLDLPGGSIKTESGEILIRLKERKDYKKEFAEIPIIVSKNGTSVKLEDIAEIKDGFEDSDVYVTYNGKPAIGLDVYRVGEQTPVSVSKAVRKHVEILSQTLPAGVHLNVVNDMSEIFEDRMNLLMKNGMIGLVLVFVLLGLFLEPRLAFWVTMGIPISFLGSLFILPQFDTSINMISLFAFIVSLGIVVDDAVVVGENIYSHRKNEDSFLKASIKGAREIAMPVVFSVLTNMVAFMPLYFVPGFVGKIFKTIPVVVIAVFFISLIESLFILPAHLSHGKKESRSRIMDFINGKQRKVSEGLTNFIYKYYKPFLKLNLKYRYVCVSIAVVILIMSIAYIKSGRMGLILFPKVESDMAYVSAVLPYGSPAGDLKRVEKVLMDSANKTAVECGGEKQMEGSLSIINSNQVSIRIYMTDPDKRPFHTAEFVAKWRENTGNTAGLESIKFLSDRGGPGSGDNLTVELQHKDEEVLKKASRDIAAEIEKFPQTSDVDDGFILGKKQFDFILKPQAYHLNLTPNEIAYQIRNAYYGFEVVRQLRGRNEVKITVKLDEKERKSEHYLEQMLITTPAGVQVPLRDIVEIKKSRAYTSIERRHGKKIILVGSDVNPPSETEKIIAFLKQDTLPKLKARYSGLSYSFEGKQADMRESMAALSRGMLLALMMVYVLLAIPFKSYIQPLIIILSIPFGIVGAMLGHIIMGYNLSILSMFGIVALSGVVVNDSLVLVDFANRQVRNNSTPYSAVINAGITRFRPIMLTTLTTFFGLMPMIFETSRQAKFLIPMAISLGFGILFSTLIILLIVPSFYIMIEDLKGIVSKLHG